MVHWFFGKDDNVWIPAQRPPLKFYHADVGRTQKEFVNNEPQASNLRILRVFYQHPKWFISPITLT